MAARSWVAEALPAETVEAVRGAVDPLAGRIVAAVRGESSVYAAVLDGPEGIGIRLGIEQAIKAFLEGIEHGERPAPEAAELWRRLGEAEFQAGRSLDALRAAFRTGTRAAWRGAADIAVQAGVPAPTVVALAEAIFIYTDELAADVVAGYLRMQSDAAGERERRRRRLATLLLDGDGSDPEATSRAAELARWPLPKALAVLMLASETAAAVTRRLDVDVLVAGDAGAPVLVIPDPDGPGRQKAIERAVREVPCALGPSVAPRDAERSLRLARTVLNLLLRGALPSQRPTRAVDHIPMIMLLQDDDLARALVERTLAPLERVRGADRDRLLETLQAWLEHQRHTPRIAAALHVHPQTVRYRLGKLRELLGTALDEPERRLEIELALRAWRAQRG